MRFEILGEPVGEGRPRAVRRGTSVRMHSAPRSAQWRALAAQQMAAAIPSPPLYGADVCVTVWIVAVMPRPKLPKKAGVARLYRPNGADVDNIAKAVLDAMVTAGVIADDRTVAVLQIEKVTAAVGELPRVVVNVAQVAWTPRWVPA